MYERRLTCDPNRGKVDDWVVRRALKNEIDDGVVRSMEEDCGTVRRRTPDLKAADSCVSTGPIFHDHRGVVFRLDLRCNQSSESIDAAARRNRNHDAELPSRKSLAENDTRRCERGARCAQNRSERSSTIEQAH